MPKATVNGPSHAAAGIEDASDVVGRRLTVAEYLSGEWRGDLPPTPAEEGGAPSPTETDGGGSSGSSQRPVSSGTTSGSGSRRAPTTGNPSRRARTGRSSAATTGGSTPATGTPPSEGT